jgi:hypothetical protein
MARARAFFSGPAERSLHWATYWPIRLFTSPGFKFSTRETDWNEPVAL